MFESHLVNPAYLCSDDNPIYENYCNLKNIPHYEKSSNYLTILEKNGYRPVYCVPADKAQETEEKNQKILEKLYNAELIDKITNRGYMSYPELLKLKNQNSLSLGKVNELHSNIKKFIYADMTNVSTKYLQDYIGLFTYIRNWKVEHGHYPTSKKDTEEIFINILKTCSNYTISDIKS